MRGKKKTILTPSTSSKCSSLQQPRWCWKIRKNLLHLLNKNFLKFDTNLTMDLGGTIIWNKTPEALSWKSFHELHYKHPLLPASVAPLQQPRWCWKIRKNLLHLLNKNCFKFHTNPTVDLGGTIIWNKTSKALSWNSFHAYFLHTSFPWTTFPHIRTNFFSHIHSPPFLFFPHKIFLSPLVSFHDLSLSLFPLSNESFEILPSNQWTPHPSRADENWEWFALQLILGWEFLGPMRHKKYSIL